MKSSILVTGAAGFIGSCLCARLLELGFQVHGVDSLEPNDVSLKKDRLARLLSFVQFSFSHVDIADSEAFGKSLADYPPYTMVHLAAESGVRFRPQAVATYGRSNLTGFLNVLEASRTHAVRHLVLASSSSVYGAVERLPQSTTSPTEHPLSLYGATKKANEVMAHSYSHLFGIPITVLRLFSVYGPWGRPDMIAYAFTQKILAGESIPLYNGGSHRRDFTFIEDVIEVITRVLPRPPQPDASWDAQSPSAATSKSPFRVYNVGSQTGTSVLELVALLESRLGRKAKVEWFDRQPADMLDTIADTQDLHRDFGYCPSTPLQEGVDRFVDWYLSRTTVRPTNEASWI